MTPPVQKPEAQRTAFVPRRIELAQHHSHHAPAAFARLEQTPDDEVRAVALEAGGEGFDHCVGQRADRAREHGDPVAEKLVLW
ncbi:MAG: hypothetical protein QOI98_541 [Solirubrobacteraceae bacterium]|jgi:hypothetical protein|nr:hypothetical protein [Solirubrobacteraceae bacterium]